MILGCIYKITCIPNGKFYIGMTIQKPLKRWNAHKRNPNKKMRNDIQRYGWDNFKKEVLISNIEQYDLPKLEIDYISNFTPEYNTSKGGFGGSGLAGEDNPAAKLTEGEVLDIRAFYGKKVYTLEQMSYMYKVSAESIGNVVTGRTWKHIGGEIKADAIINMGERNGSAKLTDTDIPKIRELYNIKNISSTKVGKLFGIGSAEVRLISTGKTWNHIKEGIDISSNEYKKARHGENNYFSKLTAENVLSIRKEYATGEYETYKDYLQKSGYCVKELAIYRVIAGKTWKKVGGPIKGIDYINKLGDKG